MTDQTSSYHHSLEIREVLRVRRSNEDMRAESRADLLLSIISLVICDCLLRNTTPPSGGITKLSLSRRGGAERGTMGEGREGCRWNLLRARKALVPRRSSTFCRVTSTIPAVSMVTRGAVSLEEWNLRLVKSDKSVEKGLRERNKITKHYAFQKALH